jgi:glycosyltransferase involved in cell wall biosynthesis
VHGNSALAPDHSIHEGVLLKILHLSTSDGSGGAARAAYRLNEALIEEGIDSEMAVQQKLGHDSFVRGPRRAHEMAMRPIRSRIDSLPVQFYRSRLSTPFSVGWVGSRTIAFRANALRPDVLHLHWLNGGFVSLQQLPSFSAPLLWSLHDMWAFTGGCHYNNLGCRKYYSRCGRCPVLNSQRTSDLSRRIWRHKKRVLDRIDDLTIVGVSTWMASEARRSSLFQSRRIVVLPNPIDSTVFRPIDRAVARDLWQLPKDVPIVGFGAINPTSSYNKGYDLLIEALRQLKVPDAQVVVFGGSSADNELPFPVHQTGRIHDDVSLVTLYNAIDVLVVPSRLESFGQTASEAMSCGTPVVAFRTSGLLDVVDHCENGFLAEPYHPESLAVGIRWILGHKDRYERLRIKAREKVVSNFDYSKVAPQYIDLYHDIKRNRI